MGKIISFSSCILLCIFSASTWAQNGAISKENSAAVSAVQNQSASTGWKGHPLAVSLARLGAFACVERANQMANFLDAGQSATVIAPPPEDNPNQRLMMPSLLIPSSNGVAIASIALAPAQANGCGSGYRVVSFLEMSCRKAIEMNYASLKFSKLQGSEVELAIVGKKMQVIAMPAGTGCVFDKQEIVQ